MRTKNFYIINPAAGFKKTKKNQKHIIKLIKDLDFHGNVLLTHHPFHASFLAKEAILKGADRIIAIGGDGTLNEVLNGLFDNGGELLNKNLILAQVPSGTGADFARNFPKIRNYEEALKEAINKDPKLTDIGFVKAHDSQGQNIYRYFINESSLGISGLVAGIMRQTSRTFGGKAAYFWSTAKAIKQFNPSSIIIKNEKNEEKIIDNCHLVTFANGQYIGSGMHIAPRAILDDGLFDVIGVKDLSVGFFMANGYKIYMGTHLDLPNVSFERGKDFFVASIGKDPIFIETDGEMFGKLPARFTILEKKLLVVRN